MMVEVLTSLQVNCFTERRRGVDAAGVAAGGGGGAAWRH